MRLIICVLIVLASSTEPASTASERAKGRRSMADAQKVYDVQAKFRSDVIEKKIVTVTATRTPTPKASSTATPTPTPIAIPTLVK